MKRKVTDLKPNEAILISNDAERDAILQLMDRAGWVWNDNSEPFEYIPTNPYPIFLCYKALEYNGICIVLPHYEEKNEFTIHPATDFIGSEGEDEGSTIESVFKLADWILKHRVSSLIDADIPQQDKDRIARHFGYSADFTTP